MEESDQKLVARTLAGDLKALETLLSRYEPAAFRYAASIVGNGDDAEDVIQEAFIKAYRNLRTYRLDRPFRPWLYRIVRNEAFNWRRKYRRFLTGEAAELILVNTEDPAEDAQTALERKEIRDKLRTCLAKLSDAYREPLVLYYIDERSYAEISEIMRLPVNSVATRLRRAKEQLRRIYEQA